MAELMENSKIVVTVVGKDKKGIIAQVSGKIAQLDGNILDITQTILQGNFTMIMIVDLAESPVSFGKFKEEMELLGKEMGMVITCMHQDLFQFMHRI